MLIYTFIVIIFKRDFSSCITYELSAYHRLRATGISIICRPQQTVNLQQSIYLKGLVSSGAIRQVSVFPFFVINFVKGASLKSKFSTSSNPNILMLCIYYNITMACKTT